MSIEICLVLVTHVLNNSPRNICKILLPACPKILARKRKRGITKKRKGITISFFALNANAIKETCSKTFLNHFSKYEDSLSLKIHINAQILKNTSQRDG